MANSEKFREIFDLPDQATSHEIRNAFLKKAFALHPDMHPDTSLEEFRRVCHAYEELRWLPVFLWTGEREIEMPSQQVDFDHYSLQDAFQTFGATISGSFETTDPLDVVVPCRIELRDILLGNYKTIRVTREVGCPECGGKGNLMGGYCRACGGKGSTRQNERISFEVPPGSTTGNLFVVSDKGNFSYATNQYGDLVILFEESLPPHFRRKGVDCLCEAEADLTVLALGGTAFAESPSGERAYFKVPPATPTGRTISIPGQGFPQYRTRSWGNLLCRIIPKLPTLDGAERDLFVRLRELHIQRGGIQYRTQGRFGVLVIRPENDSPMIADELVDLAVVLQTSGLIPAVDLTALIPFASRSVLNALVAVYNRCFQRGQMKVVANPEVAIALKGLQIGALFEVLVGSDNLDGNSQQVPANPFQMVRRGRWEVYPMGAKSLICDYLLETPDLLENLEAQGHPFKAFDMSQVPQIDSFLIGKLIRIYKFCHAAGGDVVLIGASETVARVLQDTGILGLFSQVANIDALQD